MSYNKSIFEKILQKDLFPLVTQIDKDGVYPEKFIKTVLQADILSLHLCSEKERHIKIMKIIEETAKYCLTSAFTLWCHFASVTTIREGGSNTHFNGIRELIETGKLLAGTGLSNALKYYAGIEPVKVHAVRKQGGYCISGTLPSVSNLGENHCFVIMATLDSNNNIICLVPTNTPGLKMTRSKSFVALNGTATYSCAFQDAFIADDLIVTEDAELLIPKIRSIFSLYQIPLALGLSRASLKSLEENYFEGHINIIELKQEFTELYDKAYKLASSDNVSTITKEILEVRLKVVKFVTKVTHYDMVYAGGKGYLEHSSVYRRLRESYFLVNLTPSIQQLERMIPLK